MRYIQPKVTATLPAVSAIKGIKDQMPDELNVNLLTSAPAYKADE